MVSISTCKSQDNSNWIYGQLGEVRSTCHPDCLDELFPQLPLHAVLVSRCDVGEQYVLSSYELLTQTLLVPNQKTVRYSSLLYQEDLE